MDGWAEWSANGPCKWGKLFIFVVFQSAGDAELRLSHERQPAENFNREKIEIKESRIFFIGISCTNSQCCSAQHKFKNVFLIKSDISGDSGPVSAWIFLSVNIFMSSNWKRFEEIWRRQMCQNRPKIRIQNPGQTIFTHIWDYEMSRRKREQRKNKLAIIQEEISSCRLIEFNQVLVYHWLRCVSLATVHSRDDYTRLLCHCRLFLSSIFIFKY